VVLEDGFILKGIERNLNLIFSFPLSSCVSSSKELKAPFALVELPIHDTWFHP